MVRSAVKAPAGRGRDDGDDRRARSPPGKKSGSRDLAAEIFEATVSVPLMHQVVVAGLAGIRAGTHSTKTRGDVRGGGKKPWRQKGTGRARQGSIRSPQWVGGGVAHGPQPRDHDDAREQEDAQGRAALGAHRRPAERQARRGRRALVRRAQDEAGGRAARRARARRARSWSSCRSRPSDGAVEKSFRNLRRRAASPTRAASAPTTSCWADRVLFTGDALDALEGEGPRPRRRRGR